ncbi:carboxymuconolactone decarboxylase family protein [Demequina sp. NBRC 110054]|uniref:carboxymuconolactone decarboxylase family protein n=1 Tax=Demequina sp. NBRC 110054 TaxID=1570343 RepID=UPI000A01B79C|nr:carboxymuconolactone decarboxylase family protein [Demequina sp. NBRC 110054]
MARIPDLEPGGLDAAQAALYDAIAGGPRAAGPQHFALTRPDGSLRGPFNAMLLAPDLGAALQGVGSALRYRGALSDRAREIAILLVAARWDSAFEREAHEAVGAACGLTGDELAALRAQDPTSFDGDDAVVALAVLALLDGDLDDAAWADLESSLGAAVAFELTTLVGYYATLALQLRVFRVGS